MSASPPAPSTSMTLDKVLALIETRLAEADFGGAEHLCRQVLATVPAHEPATRLLLRVLVAAGNDQAAEPVRRRILALEAVREAQQLERRARADLSRAAQMLDQSLPELGDLPAVSALRWDVGRTLGDRPWYYSQSGQDAYVHTRLFGDRRGGVFVDVGAFDGITGSNTLFFEQSLGWTGLCIEPAPAPFARLQQIRRATCVQLGIADRDGQAEFVSFEPSLTQMGGLRATYDPRMRQRALEGYKQTEHITQVPVRRLMPLLADHGITAIDLLCIDVEGAESMILTDFDFQSVSVQALLVENNHQEAPLRVLMRDRGYRMAARLGADDLFIHANAVVPSD
jgi:FkbM family methyltransferase